MSHDLDSVMRAVLMDEPGAAEVLRVGDAERPVPSTGQVLIEVAAASVNRPDIIQRQGNYPPPPGESEILGLEVAGTVVELGEGAGEWRVGDRVMALVAGGGYADFAVAYAGHVMPVPESMGFEGAACVCETYITAFLNVFRIGGLADDDTVLLHGGGGGVNTAALQLCGVLTPAATTIVTASPGKTERLVELGADVVIDYTSEDFAAVVRTATDKRGADVILDHIGAKYLDANMKALAVGGRLVIIGVMGGAVAELNLARMMVKRQRVIGSVLRSRPVEEKAAIVADFRAIVLPRFADRSIAPLIDRVLPLESVREAHELMESSGHFGKIVLSISRTAGC